MNAKYREFASQTRLQNAIECFWTGETPPFDAVQRVLPDGCADILFSRGAENRSAGRRNDEPLRRFPTAAGPAARRECQFFPFLDRSAPLFCSHEDYSVTLHGCH